MSKNVTFYLGPAIDLASRRLRVRRHARAGDDTIPVADTVDVTLAGSATYSTQELADNTIWEARLLDTANGTEVSSLDVLSFHTGSLQFPGPSSGDRLQIYKMEDLSSSSSSSSCSCSESSSCSCSESSSCST